MGTEPKVDIGDMSRPFTTNEASVLSDGYSFQCAQGDTTRKLTQMVVTRDGIVLSTGLGTNERKCIDELGLCVRIPFNLTSFAILAIATPDPFPEQKRLKNERRLLFGRRTIQHSANHVLAFRCGVCTWLLRRAYTRHVTKFNC